jgi:hypothetical protein
MNTQVIAVDMRLLRFNTRCITDSSTKDWLTIVRNKTWVIKEGISGELQPIYGCDTTV